MRYILVIGLLLVAGCSVRTADLTVISPKNINLAEVDLDKAPQVKNVEGVDSKFFFLIPFNRPVLKEAIDDALRKADGDLMIDVAIYHEAWWFIFGQQELRVKGTVVKTRGGSDGR